MVYSTISQVESQFQDSYIKSDIVESFNNTQNYSGSIIPSNENSQIEKQILKVKIATALSFWCGCIQVNIRPL